MTFAQAITNVMADAGYNSTVLGAKVGVTASQIERYRSGRQQPRADVILRLIREMPSLAEKWTETAA